MTTTSTTAELVHAYFDSWKNGADRYDAERLRTLLAPELDFEGPLAGHRVGAEGFIVGLGDFARRLRDIRMVRQTQCGEQHAFLYDCEAVSGATLRIAEFITTRDGRIQTIKILYDKGDFAKLG